MKYPPPRGAQNKGKTDYTRRRRWVRSRRQLAPPRPSRPSAGAAAEPPNLMDMDQQPTSRGSEPADAEERVVLGIVQPQELIPLPPGWQSSGERYVL